ncbi:FAD binding domain-containing protein [Mycena alexandri]|uniref:FAD binding domain-containing protein n=1 Tax=Mycena alexandri TaxID=1745969 RepID=A0AAD6WSE6_9AGAR|nr:FAD binding domain-containing protein [Mycena alexandri]
MSKPNRVDVLLVGGGPTSLVLTNLLLRSGHKILTLEQYDKFRNGVYGRGCMFFAGSLELLDLIGIYERVADIGFIVSKSMTFKDGAQINNRGWSFVQETLDKSDTMFKFNFSLRQKHLEDALLVAIDEIDSDAVKAPTKLVHYRTVDSPDYPIIATIQDREETREVHCKYLIGADGGRSIVRQLGNFHFPGAASVHKWVRLDAVVKTDMPCSRSHFISIESKDNGNVLWCPTDSGRTRIGFVYHHHGGKITEDLIMKLAKEAVHPFTLEFIKLDWWTIYEVGQRIADTFRKGPVFLAGDAAHTHSSGAAQGMNGGMRDAVNLAWKLSGVLSGLYHEDILDTYSPERRRSAEQVIKLDKDLASLISGTIPEHFNAPPEADPYEYLNKLHSQNAMFTTGLGISYGENWINRPPRNGIQTEVKVGQRAPDGQLFRPGRATAQPLRTFVRYTGRFWVLVFAGRFEECGAKYRAFCSAIDSSRLFFPPRSTLWDFLTIFAGQGSLPPSEVIGTLPLGKVLYDHSGEVFSTYGIGETSGLVVVLRPDSIISFMTSVDGPGANELSAYFESLAGHKVGNSLSRHSGPGNVATGYEFDVEGEEVSGYLVKSDL